MQNEIITRSHLSARSVDFLASFAKIVRAHAPKPKQPAIFVLRAFHNAAPVKSPFHQIVALKAA